jgi:L-threonylcarbamoyladenylate synthase
VYGIAAIPTDKKAVQKLYRIKGRSNKKPIALLISSTDILTSFAKTVPPAAKRLIKKNWPGALTLIFKKKKSVPDFLTSNMSTIGIRMPKSKIALQIIKAAGGALAVTSANISGEKPAIRSSEIKKLKGIDLIIKGSCKIGIPSSVVAISGKKIQVLRRGPLLKL